MFLVCPLLQEQITVGQSQVNPTSDAHMYDGHSSSYRNQGQFTLWKLESAQVVLELFQSGLQTIEQEPAWLKTKKKQTQWKQAFVKQ